MTRPRRIAITALLEFTKVLECAVSLGAGFAALAWLYPIDDILAFVAFAGISQAFCGVAYVLNRNTGLDEMLEECWEPVNKWIERSFLWLPGAR